MRIHYKNYINFYLIKCNLKVVYYIKKGSKYGWLIENIL